MKTCLLYIPRPKHGDMQTACARELSRAGLTFADVRIPGSHYHRWTYGPIRYTPALDVLKIKKGQRP